MDARGSFRGVSEVSGNPLFIEDIATELKRVA